MSDDGVSIPNPIEVPHPGAQIFYSREWIKVAEFNNCPETEVVAE